MFQVREVCGHLQVSEGAVQAQKRGAPGGSHQTCQVEFLKQKKLYTKKTIHGIINYKDTKTKCRHLQKLTCTGTF
jgi:hypothetical protein